MQSRDSGLLLSMRLGSGLALRGSGFLLGGFGGWLASGLAGVAPCLIDEIANTTSLTGYMRRC